jgi:GNAT superfamily N-acetyltransferase
VRYLHPVPLGSQHRLDDFDCGEPALDEWLKKYGRQAASAGSARVYVSTLEDKETVIGYYALTVASIEPEIATERVRKGQPRQPIPAVLLARLAVDADHQGAGVGHSLFRDAMLRALDAADSVGIRVLLVHAKHELAKGFYMQYDFEESLTNPLNLQMLLKDVKETLKKMGHHA